MLQSPFDRPVRAPLRLALLLCTLILSVTIGRAQSAEIPAASPVAANLRQRFDSEFRQRLGAAPAAQIDKAEHAFLDHLQTSSSLAARELATGSIDPDDLASRIEVFVGDHPEYMGTATAPGGGARNQVAEALRKYPDLASTDADRQAQADRFIVWLGNLSASTRESLLAGRMTSDELQSRIDVYAGDLRAERSKVVLDPALAAVPAIAEAYENANLGPVTERPDSICCRATITEAGAEHSYVMFKRRPGSIRLQALKGDLVVGILAYDGVTAWRQLPGRPAEEMQGPQAFSLISSARFDDPLVGYRERGAVARLESAPGATPLRLSIREPDGTELKETIDPTTYQELSQTRRDQRGQNEERRFSDFKKIGSFRYPATEEIWIDGALHSTTHYTEVRLDAGVLARFFAKPVGFKLDYMDYMGGLAAIEKIADKHSGGIVLPTEAKK